MVVAAASVGTGRPLSDPCRLVAMEAAVATARRHPAAATRQPCKGRSRRRALTRAARSSPADGARTRAASSSSGPTPAALALVAASVVAALALVAASVVAALALVGAPVVAARQAAVITVAVVAVVPVTIAISRATGRETVPATALAVAPRVVGVATTGLLAKAAAVVAAVVGVG